MTPPPPMPHSAEPVVLSRKPDMPAMVTTFSSDHLIPSAVRSSSFISDRGFNPQLQHTRRDPWFSNDRSTGKMGYLYSNSTPSQVSFMRSKSDCNSACNTALPQLQQHSAQRSYSLMPPTMNSPTSLAYSEKPAAPAVSSSNPSSRSALTPPDAVPVQRSMSLLAMLDAPPEQRTLPPLPPLPHHP
ncbi:hypothetical protein EC988_001813 [Linderina pennispora]|nr:hypothetical protein EC988_001813 [Linderina pennispora]